MIKILQYLITIRLRKLLPKGDTFAIVLFFLFYGIVIFFLNKIYSTTDYGKYFIYGSILDIFLYHLKRKDLELLTRFKYKKILILIEYSIYSIPFLYVYIFNSNWIFVGILYIAMITIIFLKQPSFRIIKYPFRLFDPFWHISFRKYKLLFFFPSVLLLNYLGWEYENENLNIASLVLAALFASLSSFEREDLHHIKISSFMAKQYLMKQLVNSIYNTSFLCLPIILCFIIFLKWDLILFFPLIYFLPLVNILLKYSFYYNKLLHQLFFILFLIYTQSGLTLLIIPILYYKSHKNIQQIKNA